MFLGAMILTGNAVGIIRGEWRGTARKTQALMLTGVLFLAVAFAILGMANQKLGANMNNAPTYSVMEKKNHR